MNIVLINPKGYDYRCTMPMGLAYIAGALRDHCVKIFDLHYNYDIAALLDYFLQIDVALAGFSVYGDTFLDVLKTIGQIKRISPSTRILLGGHYATESADEILNHYKEIDIIVRGAGEHAMQRIATSNFNDIASIPGICYRDQNEMVIIAKSLCMPIDIYPDRTKFPTPTQYSLKTNAQQVTAAIITGRGCINDCSFCAISQSTERKWKRRSYEDIEQEIQELYEQYDVRHLYFFDADFLLSPQHVKRVCAMLQKYGDLTFTCTGCVNSVLRCKFLLDDLRNAGCMGIEVGIESAAQTQLDRYNKHISVSDIDAVTRLLPEHGIPIEIDLIPFDPYVTIDELQETLCFFYRNTLTTPEYEDRWFITLSLYPGTEYKSMMQKAQQIRDGSHNIYWDFYHKKSADYYRYVYYYENVLWPRVKFIRMRASSIIHKIVNMQDRIHYYRILSVLKSITFDYLRDVLYCFTEDSIQAHAHLKVREYTRLLDNYEDALRSYVDV